MKKQPTIDRKLRKKLKPRFSITIRVAFSFFIFGILTGWFSYMLFSFLTVKNFFNDLDREILQSQEEIKRRRMSPFLHKLHHIDDDDIIEILIVMRDKLLTLPEGFQIELYVQDNNDTHGWNQVTFDEQQKIYMISAQGEAKEQFDVFNNEIKEEDTDGKLFSSPNKFVLIGLLNPNSKKQRFAVRLIISKESLFAKIKADKEKIISFTIIIAIFSCIVGLNFAKKLTRPIRKFSKGALRIAAGDYDYRFHIKQRDEIGALANTLNYMSEQIKIRTDEITHRSRSMEAMNRIDKTVLRHLMDDDLMHQVAGIVSEFLEESAVVLAVSTEQNIEESENYIEVSSYNVVKKIGLEVKTGVFQPQGYIADEPHFRQIILKHDSDVLHGITSEILTVHAGTILVFPVTNLFRQLGILYVIDDTQHGFNEQTIEAVKMLADQVGVARQNVLMYRDREDILLGILTALTRAIDAKSKWTAGHSERVAEYAVMLGEKAELSADELEDLKISALLHDIGKLGCPESILDKPGKLTDEEYAVIKAHPDAGATIVEGIKAYSRIFPAIRQHHERYDGRGYPQGLSGTNISTAGRIVMICDVYDAISADRPYRKGMSPEQVHTFMHENSGIMFDPHLLDLFMDLVDKE